MTLEAVVFDFDGLIIDSEWVIYETACAAFAAHGHELPVQAWSTIVGTNDKHDPHWWTRLCGAVGIAGFERADYDAAYEAQDRSNRDELPALPGVLELVAALESADVPIGIASSSSLDWLQRHLGRLGLEARFGALVGADLVGGVGKPAPDVYLRACAELGADPTRSVAIEDSGHGATAAKAAGMAVVVVPSRITRFNDLAHADLVVDSLTDVGVPDLAALANRPRR
ncbi:MAG: HAD family phosphatase [Acidimicrobiales bacterium]|nr:HAD family phosphatase [Acidimicrobiales bacterium]